MTTAIIPSRAWRLVPLLTASAYAVTVVLLWGGGHGAQLAALSLGYVSAIAVAAVFAVSLASIYGVWTRGRPTTARSTRVSIRAFITARWRVDRGLSLCSRRSPSSSS